MVLAAAATIQGRMQMFLIPATTVGPTFAGYVYDVTGSYYQAFMLFMVLYLVGAGILPFVRRPTMEKEAKLSQSRTLGIGVN